MVPPKQETTRPIGHNANGLPIKVLVVDDEFSHRRLMIQLLKSAGFNVMAEGTNGEEAIHYVKLHNPDYLFMDFHMPRMDGLAALKELHVSHPQLRVIMFTTETEKDHVTEVLKAGAVAYIVKPIDRVVVLKKLTELLRP